MPYSVDAEENKRNPVTPSPLISFQEQLIYKLAALDASVQGGFRRLDEKIDRLQTDLHKSQIETNDRINSLDKDLETLERDHVSKAEHAALLAKIEILERWQNALVARITAIGGVVILFWTLFGDAVKLAIGIP